MSGALRERVREATGFGLGESSDSSDGGEPHRAKGFERMELIVPLLAVLFVMVEVYGVAHFNVTSAIAMIEAAGPEHVAAGAIVVYLPFILPLAAIVAVGWALRLRRQRRSSTLQLFAWGLAFSCVILTSWLYLLLVLGVIAGYIALMVVLVAGVNAFRGRRAHGQPAPPFRVRPGQIAVIAAIVFFFLSLTDPWVPPEIVLVKAAPHVSHDILQPDDGFARVADGFEGIGYVLKVDLEEITILTAKNRRVLTLPVHDVLSRHVCFTRGHRSRVPLFGLIANVHPAHNPRCPSPSAIVRAAAAQPAHEATGSEHP